MHDLGGPKAKNKKGKTWAVQMGLILLLTFPVKRTFSFQELLIRMEKEKKTTKEQRWSKHATQPSCSSLTQPFSLRKFKWNLKQERLPWQSTHLWVLLECFINNVAAKTGGILKDTHIHSFSFKKKLQGKQVQDDQTSASFCCCLKLSSFFFFNCSEEQLLSESSSVQFAHLLCSDLVMYKSVSSLSQTNVECLMKEFT